MADWKKYRRPGVTEMTQWTPGFDMVAVSISAADKANGSPMPGDMIARNPFNHDDLWLVAAAYFLANFAPADGEQQEYIDKLESELKDAYARGQALLDEVLKLREEHADRI